MNRRRWLWAMGGCWALSCGCAAPQQAQSDHKPIGERAVEILDPRQLIGGRALSAASRTAKQVLEQIDVQRFNAMMGEVQDLAHTLNTKTQKLAPEVLEQTASAFREVAEGLAQALEEFRASARQAEAGPRLGAALSASESSFQAVRQAADQLRGLLEDLRRVIQALELETLSDMLQRILASSDHLEAASAALPSTIFALSTTIWIVNALLAAGLGVTVLWILRLRKKPH